MELRSGFLKGITTVELYEIHNNGAKETLHVASESCEKIDTK